MLDDLDLSTVITNDPVNVPLIILEREYTRIRAAAAQLRDEHPDLDALIVGKQQTSRVNMGPRTIVTSQTSVGNGGIAVRAQVSHPRGKGGAPDPRQPVWSVVKVHGEGPGEWTRIEGGLTRKDAIERAKVHNIGLEPTPPPHMAPPYELHRIAQGYVTHTPDDIVGAFNNVVHGGSMAPSAAIMFHAVTPNEAAAINPQLKPVPHGITEVQRLPIDVNGMVHRIEPNAISHVVNSHFGSNETDSSNIPLTMKDIARIPQIISSPDEVRNVTDPNSRNPIIRYKKRFNGTTYYFEEVKEGKHNLVMKTMYAKPSPSQKVTGAQRATPQSGGVAHTSETSPGTTQIIPQPTIAQTLASQPSAPSANRAPFHSGEAAVLDGKMGTIAGVHGDGKVDFKPVNGGKKRTVDQSKLYRPSEWALAKGNAEAANGTMEQLRARRLAREAAEGIDTSGPKNALGLNKAQMGYLTRAIEDVKPSLPDHAPHQERLMKGTDDWGRKQTKMMPSTMEGVTIKVPGDGQFTIAGKDQADALLKAKPEASKNGTHIHSRSTGPNGNDEYHKQFPTEAAHNDAEVLRAQYENGKGHVYQVSSPNGVRYVKGEGEPVKVAAAPKHQFFIQKHDGEYGVTEMSTGKLVGKAKTPEEAIDNANTNIKANRADFDKGTSNVSEPLNQVYTKGYNASNGRAKANRIQITALTRGTGEGAGEGAGPDRPQATGQRGGSGAKTGRDVFPELPVEGIQSQLVEHAGSRKVYINRNAFEQAIKPHVDEGTKPDGFTISNDDAARLAAGIEQFASLAISHGHDDIAESLGHLTSAIRQAKGDARAHGVQFVISDTSNPANVSFHEEGHSAQYVHGVAEHQSVTNYPNLTAHPVYGKFVQHILSNNPGYASNLPAEIATHLADNSWREAGLNTTEARGRTGTSTTSHGFVGALGHMSEANTGLIYMRARYYDPSIGRFASEDPDKRGNNWFVYARNNPINIVDRSGLDGDLGSLEVAMGDSVVFDSFGLAEIDGTVTAVGDDTILVEVNYIEKASTGIIRFRDMYSAIRVWASGNGIQQIFIQGVAGSEEGAALLAKFARFINFNGRLW